MATKTFTGTGLASTPARWSGGTLPVAGDNIVIAAGADCTLDGAYSWGNGTSSTTLASNAIVVSGTLRGHATAPWSLTCAGSLVEGPGGSILFDQSAGGSGALILNSGGTAGQHGFVTLPGTGSCTTTIKGIPRTRNTVLSAAASSNTIQVAASTNWAIGDEIVIASPDDDPADAVLTTITGGSSPNWTLAVSVTRSAGCAVGNLSGNMVVKSATANLPAVFGISGNVTVHIPYGVRFENIGWTGGWVGAAQASSAWYYGVGLNCTTDQVIASCAHVWTHGLSTQSQAALFVSGGLSNGYGNFSDCAGYSNATSGYGFAFTNGSLSNSADNVIYRANAVFVTFNNSGAFDANLVRGKYWGGDRICNLISSTNPVYCTDGEYHAKNYVASYSGGYAKFTRGSVSCGVRMLFHNTSALSGVLFESASFGGAVLTGINTTGSVPNMVARSRLQAVNGVASDNRDKSYWRECATDLSVRKRGTYSVKIQPQVANTAITYTFTIPAVSGVAQVVKGSLRFDATYGTATPPIVSLSGQGVTSSYACAAVADAWDDFTLSFTPTSTGDITVTVTVQSASTTGFAWLDGVYHYPMIQGVRHWGYQWLPQAAQLVDTRVTLTEAAALALPVVVNHGASTVTISGAVTPSEALQAMLADLAQTANNALPVHVTGDGSTFTTSYTVVLSGAGAVSGSYADATGLHTIITAELAAGFRARLAYVSDGAEIFNGVLTGSTLAVPVVWSADRPVELRAARDGHHAIRAVGVLSSAGLPFLVTPEADTVAALSGLDPATLTEFVFDAPGVQVEVTDPDDYTEWLRMYTAWQHYQTTAEGIASALFGRFTSIDGRNFQLDQTGARVTIRNTRPDPLTIGGGFCKTSDGLPPVDHTGGSIFPAFDIAYVAQGAAAITVPAGERVLMRAADGSYYARS